MRRRWVIKIPVALGGKRAQEISQECETFGEFISLFYFRDNKQMFKGKAAGAGLVSLHLK